MLVTMEISNIRSLSKKKAIRMLISVLILSLIILVAPTDAHSNASCSVCNCRLKSAESLIGFIDNRVQTLVQNILNVALADQPSKYFADFSDSYRYLHYTLLLVT